MADAKRGLAELQLRLLAIVLLFSTVSCGGDSPRTEPRNPSSPIVVPDHASTIAGLEAQVRELEELDGNLRKEIKTLRNETKIAMDAMKDSSVASGVARPPELTRIARALKSAQDRIDRTQREIVSRREVLKDYKAQEASADVEQRLVAVLEKVDITRDLQRTQVMRDLDPTAEAIESAEITKVLEAVDASESLLTMPELPKDLVGSMAALSDSVSSELSAAKAAEGNKDFLAALRHYRAALKYIDTQVAEEWVEFRIRVQAQQVQVEKKLDWANRARVASDVQQLATTVRGLKSEERALAEVQPQDDLVRGRVRANILEQIGLLRRILVELEPQDPFAKATLQIIELRATEQKDAELATQATEAISWFGKPPGLATRIDGLLLRVESALDREMLREAQEALRAIGSPGVDPRVAPLSARLDRLTTRERSLERIQRGLSAIQADARGRAVLRDAAAFTKQWPDRALQVSLNLAIDRALKEVEKGEQRWRDVVSKLALRSKSLQDGAAAESLRSESASLPMEALPADAIEALPGIERRVQEAIQGSARAKEAEIREKQRIAAERAAKELEVTESLSKADEFATALQFDKAMALYRKALASSTVAHRTLGQRGIGDVFRLRANTEQPGRGLQLLDTSIREYEKALGFSDDGRGADGVSGKAASAFWLCNTHVVLAQYYKRVGRSGLKKYQTHRGAATAYRETLFLQFSTETDATGVTWLSRAEASIGKL